MHLFIYLGEELRWGVGRVQVAGRGGIIHSQSLRSCILINASLQFQLVCCCLEELGLARALRVRDMAGARRHGENMAVYHHHRAMYASALIAMVEGNYHTAIVEIQRVLDAQRRCVCGCMCACVCMCVY